MRSEILNLLREKSPQPVSGQDLANHFGITRTAVWKHIQSLKKMGYGIEAYTKKGYVLVSVPNKLFPRKFPAISIHGLSAETWPMKTSFPLRTIS